MKKSFLARLFVFTDEPKHRGFYVLPMEHLPELPRPGVGHLEVGVLGHKCIDKHLRLAGLFELLIEPQGQELACAYLNTLGLFLFDDGCHVWLKGREEAGWHLQLQLEVLHGSWHEVLVAPFVE